MKPEPHADATDFLKEIYRASSGIIGRKFAGANLILFYADEYNNV